MFMFLVVVAVVVFLAVVASRSAYWSSVWLRVWVVLSILWVAVFGLFPSAIELEHPLRLLLLVAIPPVASLIAGRVLVWVFR